MDFYSQKTKNLISEILCCDVMVVDGGLVFATSWNALHASAHMLIEFDINICDKKQKHAHLKMEFFPYM